MRKQTIIPQPTGGELEVLTVLLNSESEQAMKLSEIHKRIKERRQKYGDPIPAYTTVSSVLRLMVNKGLLEEGRLENGQFTLASRNAIQSTLQKIRSPNTAYRSVYTPGQLMIPVFRVLTDVYPKSKRRLAILDVAQALDLDKETLEKIQKLLLRN